MALREFVDQSGRAWSVWEMIPEKMHQRMRATLGAFQGGWLVFECGNGEKKRLSPIPANWELYTDEELMALSARASPARVTPDRGSRSVESAEPGSERRS